MKKLSLILLTLLLCLSTACAQTLPAKDPAPVDTSEPSAAPTAELCSIRPPSAARPPR